jgi:hypothetical protein
MQKPQVKEIIIGFALGLFTNLIWALLSEQLNPYIILLVFVIFFILYYLFSNFVLKPNEILSEGKIKAIYDSYKQAKPFIIQKLRKASSIKILLIGGGTIAEDNKAEMLDILRHRALEGVMEIKILLENPHSQNMLNRVTELKSLRPKKYSLDAVQIGIENNARKIMLNENKIQVRYYETLPIWRMFILDDVAIISAYLANKEGHETQELVLEKGTDLFDAFSRNFDAIWDSGTIPSV